MAKYFVTIQDEDGLAQGGIFVVEDDAWAKDIHEAAGFLVLDMLKGLEDSRG